MLYVIYYDYVDLRCTTQASCHVLCHPPPTTTPSIYYASPLLALQVSNTTYLL